MPVLAVDSPAERCCSTGRRYSTSPSRRSARCAAGACAYIAQSAAAAFNIAHTLGGQITEGPSVHATMSRAEAEAQMADLAQRMRLPEPDRIGRKYPHQVSGGQLQRLLAVMAMSCGPDMLVFDEPTTAIDVTTQVEVLAAFKDVIQQSGAAALYVTHDLAVVAQMADRIIVLYGGEIMEQGDTDQILHEPQHEYTRQLMAAVRPPPRASAPGADLESSGQRPVLSLQGINAGYGGTKGGRPGVQILFDVDVDIPRGQAVGVIGESGLRQVDHGARHLRPHPLVRGARSGSTERRFLQT